MAISTMRPQSQRTQRAVRAIASSGVATTLPVAMSYCWLIIGQNTVGVMAQMSRKAKVPPPQPELDLARLAPATGAPVEQGFTWSEAASAPATAPKLSGG